MNRIRLILFFLLVFLPSVFAEASELPARLGTASSYIVSMDLVLTNEDKTEIMKQMLTTEITRFKKDHAKYNELPDGDLEIILSVENIEPDLVPKIQDVKFILLTSAEIQKKIERTRIPGIGGVQYIAFREFKIEGSKVIVHLANTYIKKSRRTFLHSKTFEYEYRMVNGKWEGKLLRAGEMIT